VACQEMAGASAAATAQGAAAAAECEASTAHSEAGAADWHDSWGVVCVGELGIGNTTAAAALVAALCPDLAPLDVCGRGTGQSHTLGGVHCFKASAACHLVTHCEM
jgi:NaMN:DMB phosphoribosyltransferase